MAVSPALRQPIRRPDGGRLVVAVVAVATVAEVWPERQCDES